MAQIITVLKDPKVPETVINILHMLLISYFALNSSLEHSTLQMFCKVL